MRPLSPPSGAVQPLARTFSSRTPDPLELYQQLASPSRVDTLLLETVDIRTRQAEQSFILSRCALRLEARGDTATLTPLTPTGHIVLPHIAQQLEASASTLEILESGVLRATFPEVPHAESSEDARLKAPSTLDALRAMIAHWQLVQAPAHTSVLAAGALAYDLVERFEALPPSASDPLGFPDLLFYLPEELVVINHRTHTTRITTLVFGGGSTDAAYHDAVARLETLAEAVEACPERALVPDERVASAARPKGVDTSDQDFAALVSDLKEHIVAGDVFQIVPSRTFSAPCPDPLAAYARLRSLNPSPYMFFIASPEHTLFGASPETAVKVSGQPRMVEIRPIAGTAARGRTPEGNIDLDLDSRLEVELRLSEKELAEHMMLIDLARNDVARVSQPGTRHVPRLLTVDHYSHVMHLVSYVAGTLRHDLDALHAYTATMNMGTLVGAPKIKAAQILRHRETTRRGPYGGGVGYITADGEMDTAIVIRSALVKDGVAYVRAGAGVVHDSHPEAEAEETWRKAQAVLKAIEGA